MYKNYQADDYKKFFGLPSNYSINGLLVSGSWKEDQEFDRLEKTLRKVAPDTIVSKLPEGFLASGYEVVLGDKKLWFFTLYGGAMLSEVAHLACLFGSKKNIHIGLAAGLQEDLQAGDIIIPTEVTKDGTMSFMYDRDGPMITSDAKLSDLLQKRIGKNVIKGKTTTCQAMLGETPGDIEAWKKEGYYAVEMEAATLLSVSKHFGAPAASILTISDNLVSKKSVLSDEYASYAKKINISRDESMSAALGELSS